MKRHVLFMITILVCGGVFSLKLKASDATDLENEKKLSQDYLFKMAQEKDAVVIQQGVILRPIFKSPSTVFPSIENTVHISYYLTDRDGQLIEESISSDEDVGLPLEKVIKCWQIAFPKIAVGSAYKITCPADTAYGDSGAGDFIKPGAALTFRITLFGL